MADINTATISGRLTKDPELRALPDGTHTCSFTVACNRAKRKDEEESVADFIMCVVWRQQADFLTTYGHKGDVVGVTGKIRNRSYVNRDGNTVYITEIQADNVTLMPKNKSQASTNYTESTKIKDIELPEPEDDLPF